jgi:hypothetical protein
MRVSAPKTGSERVAVVAELTAFQIKCEAKLLAALADCGSRLGGRRLEGERETYITARIDGTDLAIYIYPDEAHIFGPSADILFESPDFRSPDALCEAFVEKASELARAAVA